MQIDNKPFKKYDYKVEVLIPSEHLHLVEDRIVDLEKRSMLIQQEKIVQGKSMLSLTIVHVRNNYGIDKIITDMFRKLINVNYNPILITDDGSTHIFNEIHKITNMQIGSYSINTQTKR